MHALRIITGWMPFEHICNLLETVMGAKKIIPAAIVRTPFKAATIVRPRIRPVCKRRSGLL
jgi:hypothetical protein